ncbi:hypothetical protein [Thermoflexibacter ruber]|uniref:Uncharacterized protein n=1 Tax=Thermoflexibacter ruber TaxID=1003 RepID=A0A1I2K7B4_9BACT|nr:hypothetical protein [Thermoflexibacter ruber]SFF61077.1 hypothetical protein SAMN04488541_10817 [Thermoflexibacter ruber]
MKKYLILGYYLVFTYLMSFCSLKKEIIKTINLNNERSGYTTQWRNSTIKQLEIKNLLNKYDTLILIEHIYYGSTLSYFCSVYADSFIVYFEAEDTYPVGKNYRIKKTSKKQGKVGSNDFYMYIIQHIKKNNINHILEQGKVDHNNPSQDIVINILQRKNKLLTIQTYEINPFTPIEEIERRKKWMRN